MRFYAPSRMIRKPCTTPRTAGKPVLAFRGEHRCQQHVKCKHYISWREDTDGGQDASFHAEVAARHWRVHTRFSSRLSELRNTRLLEFAIVPAISRAACKAATGAFKLSDRLRYGVGKLPHGLHWPPQTLSAFLRVFPYDFK